MFTLTYGAVILSFMAGIRWGTSMLVFQQDKMQLTKGVKPECDTRAAGLFSVDFSSHYMGATGTGLIAYFASGV